MEKMNLNQWKEKDQKESNFEEDTSNGGVKNVINLFVIIVGVYIIRQRILAIILLIVFFLSTNFFITNIIYLNIYNKKRIL